jgi:hypothetical protein
MIQFKTPLFQKRRVLFMRRIVLATSFLLFGSLLLAQTALNNDSVIKLVKAGLSDDLIVSTVNAAPGAYDASADGLIALKAAGASDKVVSAIVLRASSLTPPAQASVPPFPSIAEPVAPGKLTQSLAAPAVQEPAQTSSKPRVFLQSASKGTNRNAARDQSMEMSKDLEKDCFAVRVTINPQMAEYTIALNHIESGFTRDNQIQVANKDGDLLSKTKEGGSIAAGMKKACALILADWAIKAWHEIPVPAKLP